eukprot:6177071-Pleurochrysis_carterae.AAC.1
MEHDALCTSIVPTERSPLMRLLCLQPSLVLFVRLHNGPSCQADLLELSLGRLEHAWLEARVFLCEQRQCSLITAATKNSHSHKSLQNEQWSCHSVNDMGGVHQLTYFIDELIPTSRFDVAVHTIQKIHVRLREVLHLHLLLLLGAQEVGVARVCRAEGLHRVTASGI